MIKHGDTFYLRNDHDIEHLYIVLSDPDQLSEQIFIVMVSTRGDGKEECCTLQVGDHPFIRHDSVVVYRIPPAMLVSQSQLDQWKTQGRMRQKKIQESITASVLERMCKGYARSQYCTDRVYQILFRQGLIE